MANDHAMDWARASEWPERHEVRRAFARLARSTMDRKKAGFGCLAQELSPGEREVLLASRARLLDEEFGTCVEQGMAELLAGIGKGLREGTTTNWERAAWLDMMGLAPGDAWPPPSGHEARDYVVAQFRAVEARPWRHPAQAIVFSAAQAAVHLTLSTTQGQDEPEVSVDLTKEFTRNVKSSFIDAMEGEKAHLPEGAFLDVATASMTNGRDRLGADFAVVTGFIDRGVTRYRVALFQAKWEDKAARNRADVWHGKGMQLDELVATGMGYYVFYPRIYRPPAQERPPFLATVRSAEAVQADARTLAWDTRRTVSTCVGVAGDVAWDFASFLGQALASTSAVGFGRLFDTSAEVAHFLSAGRARPLTYDVLAYDLTKGRSLNLSAFVENLKRNGFDYGEVHSVLNDADLPRMDPDDVDEDEPRPSP